MQRFSYWVVPVGQVPSTTSLKADTGSSLPRSAMISAVSFLLFTLLYTPCVAAVATIKRELNSGLATIGVIVMQCGIAYVVSLVVYQIGLLII